MGVPRSTAGAIAASKTKEKERGQKRKCKKKKKEKKKKEKKKIIKKKRKKRKKLQHRVQLHKDESQATRFFLSFYSIMRLNDTFLILGSIICA